MKIHKPVISVALLLVATASLAADPPAAPAAPQTPAAAPQAPAAAPTAPSAAITPAAAPAAPKTPATPDAAATAKAAHDLGYSPRQRSGKTVYCKAEAEIGSRLSSTKCFTPEEMSAVVLRSIQNQDSVAHMQRLELYEENKH